jgi:hypothetical protein
VLKLAEVLEALTRNVTKEDNSDRYPNKGEHVHHKLHEDLQKKNEDESGHCGSNRTKSISSAVNSKLRNKRVHSEIEKKDTSDDNDDESVLSPTVETSTVNEHFPHLEGDSNRLLRNQVNLRAKRSQSQRISRRITRRPPYLTDDDSFFNVSARKYCSQNVQQQDLNGNKELRLRSRSLVTNKQGNNHDRLPRKQVKLGSKRFQNQRKITRRSSYLVDDDTFVNVTALEDSSKAVEEEESYKGGKDLRSRSLATNAKRQRRSRLPRKQVMLGSKCFQSQRRSKRISRRPPYLTDDDTFFNDSARKYFSKAVKQEVFNKGDKSPRFGSLVMNTWRIDPSVLYE